MDRYQILISLNDLDCRNSRVPIAQVVVDLVNIARKANQSTIISDAYIARKAVVTKTTLGVDLTVSFWHDEVADAAFDVLEAHLESLEHHDRMVISPLY